jgi:isoleucyl-tRNA synthetase
MKQIAEAINNFSQSDISALENSGSFVITIGEGKIVLAPEDTEIQTEDIPGWTLATEGQMTIALDINVTGELKQEGIAREFINKIQNLRKESNFEVTDRINLVIMKHDKINSAVLKHKDYICTQTLATGITLAEEINSTEAKEVEIDQDVITHILIEKLN